MRQRSGRRAQGPGALLDAVVSNMDEGVIIFDASRSVRYVNEAALCLHKLPDLPDILSRQRIEAAGISALSVDGGSLAPAAWPASRVLRGEALRDFQIKICDSNSGGEWTVSYNGVPVVNASGRVVYGVLILRDASLRSHAESAFYEVQGALETFYDHAPVIMGVVEMQEDRILAVHGNKQAVELLAPGRVESGIEDSQSTVRSGWLDAFKLCSTDGSPVRFDYERPQPDGSLWFSVIVAPVGFSKSGWRRCGFAALDITERRRAEEALRESEERVHQGASVAGVGVFSYNFQTGEQYWSPELKALLGVAPEGLVLLDSDGLWTAVHPEDRPIWAASVAAARDPAGDGTLDLRSRVVHPDGSVRWLRITCRIEFTGDGVERKPWRSVGAAVDVTYRRSAEQAQDELEAHKREFYRRTILAATDGKLLVCDDRDIKELAGPAIESWEINSDKDCVDATRRVREMALSAGIEKGRAYDFFGAVVEAATNVIKHAGNGAMSMHRAADRVICVVSDTGPGIAAMALPDLALTKFYSTAGTLGVGYKIMIHFSDRVYLAPGPEGTTVAVEMSLTRADAAN